MPRLFNKRQRYNVAKNSWLSRIVLLDSTAIEINLQPDVTGADCLERVAQCMDIVEIDYFGLRYLCKDGYVRWVDRDKSLRKQLDKHHDAGARNAELQFAVQYYVTNVSKLEFEITKYLYFLQLKHSVITGALKCTNELACKLASYALQAEFGDYDERKHTQEFLKDHILFPNYMAIDSDEVADALHEKVARLHQRHRAMSAAAAELMYIKLAQQLPEYGHEPLQQLEVNCTRIWIGACFIGIFIKHSNGQPTVYFKWPEILRMKVKDRSFAIETQQETVYFKMSDTQTAQYVLRMMINQHMFFRTEYQGLDVKWVAMKGHSKKKSTSLHDIRSATIKQSSNKQSFESSGGSLRKNEKRRSKFSRPLGKPGQRESILEPLSPTYPAFPNYRPEESPLPPSPGHIEVQLSMNSAVGDSSHQLTPSAWQDSNSKSEHSTPKKKIKEKGLGRTGIIESIPVMEDSIDIGHPLTVVLSANTDTIVNEPIGDNITAAGPTHHQFTSSYPEESSGSQESVELSHANTEQLGSGSLYHPPPQTSKQLTPDDQWEKKAISGTRDQRGQHLENILQSGKIYSEFEQIPKLTLTSDTSSGSIPTNMSKNRYKDILPYEHNRVKLDPYRNLHRNDYINASYVSFNAGRQEHCYIVSQGPTEYSCADFWQMIWEQRTQIILMLTNITEDGKKKCHRYFPEDSNRSSHIDFEQYRISSKFVETSLATVTRGFTVQYMPTGEEREVMHIQYIDWPDHGIPEDPQPFINFLKTIQSLRDKFDRNIPVVVHCSAGVGRSGVLVLSDMLTRTYDSGKVIDVPSALQYLRSQRMHLVQTLGQYRFLYTVIIQYIKNARLI